MRSTSVYAIRLDVRAREPSPHKNAHIRRDLLLEVRGDATSACVTSDGSDIGGLACGLRESDCIIVISQTGAGKPPGDCYFSRLPPELVPVRDFEQRLELVEVRSTSVLFAKSGSSKSPTANVHFGNRSRHHRWGGGGGGGGKDIRDISLPSVITNRFAALVPANW